MICCSNCVRSIIIPEQLLGVQFLNISSLRSYVASGQEPSEEKQHPHVKVVISL